MFGRLKSNAMFSNCFNKKNIPVHCFNPFVKVLMSFESVVNGQLVRQSEYKVVNYHDQFKGCKASDFSIGNLLAVGALDRLKTSYMSWTSSMNIADQFEQLTSSLEQNV